MKKILITFIALSIAAAMGLTAYGGFRHSGENSDNKQTCINYSSCEYSSCQAVCEPAADGTGKQNENNKSTASSSIKSEDESAESIKETTSRTLCEYSICENNGVPVADGTGLQYGKENNKNSNNYNSLGDNSGKCGSRGENCTSACEPSTDGSGRFGSGEGKQAMCGREFCK